MGLSKPGTVMIPTKAKKVVGKKNIAPAPMPPGKLRGGKKGSAKMLAC